MKKINWFSILALVAVMLFNAGCIKPYNKPIYVEVDTSETAFVIPLDGDSKETQVKFDSEGYLASHQVATKRIQVPQRWNQVGYLSVSGNWIPTARVVVVNRSPITRQWGIQKGAANTNTAEGTHGNPLWLQSSDNISFSIGFNCTAFVSETNAAKFLYWYRGETLANVMDTEIKARYQQAAAQISSSLKMDDLKARTQDIVHEIKNEVVPFFAERGITVTTIGQFGGVEYRDPTIMQAIELNYVNQLEKVNSAALLAAQGDKNKRIELEAIAIAEAAKTKASGEAEGKYQIATKEADGKLKLATAEAEGIRQITKALNESASSDGILRLKALDIEKTKAEKWQGGVPQTQFLFNAGDGGSKSNFALPTIIVDTRK